MVVIIDLQGGRGEKSYCRLLHIETGFRLKHIYCLLRSSSILVLFFFTCHTTLYDLNKNVLTKKKKVKKQKKGSR